MTCRSKSVCGELSSYSVPVLLALLAACQSTSNTSVVRTGQVDAVDRRIWFDAAEQGNADLLRALIDDGVDPLIEKENLNALHIAARNGHIDAAQVLIKTGIDVDSGPDAGEAALADAAGHGNRHMVELLAGTKLDPGAVAALSSLRTALNLAIQNGHADMVALLVDAGADVDAAGEWYSPLHSAVLIGDIEMVSALLEHGASTRVKIRIHDRTRFSGFRYVGPVELAELIGRDDLAEVLRDYGGRD
jgi:ankyrin repeat protein